VGFDVIDQLLIRFYPFVRYWGEKWDYNETLHELFIDFKKVYIYNIDTIEKNTETLIDARKEVGLEMNVENTECMLLSRQQNVGHKNSKQIF
jgi:hypothetical protein